MEEERAAQKTKELEDVKEDENVEEVEEEVEVINEVVGDESNESELNTDPILETKFS